MEIDKIRDLLGTDKVPGSSTRKGFAYHELPFDDIALPVHRSSLSKRLNLILKNYDIRDKKGIDLGCNVGGFVFSCQLNGATVTGYDHDSTAIELGKNIESIKKTGAVFYNKEITEDIFGDFDKIDFCIWFSQFMWLVRSLGAEGALDFMFELSKRIDDVLFFETSIGDAKAGEEMIKMGITSLEDVRDLLINNTCFQKVEFIGYPKDGWAKRPVFKCSDPRLKFPAQTSEVTRVTRNTVSKDYKKGKHDDVLRCKKYEESALSKMDSTHFPKIISNVSESELVMEYCGIPLTKENMPVNHKIQVAEILSDLRKAKITHRDIRPNNLLVKDGVIKLIDFGWAVESGNELEDAPERLGTNFKSAEGFDDEYSLKKSMDHILKNYRYYFSKWKKSLRL